MNIFDVRRSSFFSTISGQIAIVLLLSILLWATNLPSWFPTANAAALTTFSDTLTDSDLSAASDHAISFVTTNTLDVSDTIVITLDPNTSLFTINNLGASDFTGESGIDVVTGCTGNPSEATIATTTTTVTLTVCSSDTISAGTVAFTMDNAKITNPNAATSYVIRIRTTNDGGATRDSGDTRVAIIDDVVVTASVDTIFIFTIAGVANNQTINGDVGTSTATTTTATSIPFETLIPGQQKLNAQTLSVQTNARNGFRVTVVEDQPLTSATGATIDLFIDGASTTAPVAWQAPAGTLGSQWTYGHLGITSEDSSLSGGDEFGTGLYAGNIHTPREVFYHTGPADGSTAHIGQTRVGYKIQITSLQEAGNDYTNTLTYVATPTF